MENAVAFDCEHHSDRWECPDALISYTGEFDEYGIIVHDGGSSCIAMSFCPWCGSKLPDSKRDLWFETLAQLGFGDPLTMDIPKEFTDDRWWRSRSVSATWCGQRLLGIRL